MNNWVKKIKPKAKRKKRSLTPYSDFALKKYTNFNVFTKNGQNLTDVKSPRPMTLDEATDYFGALSIGGNY